MRDFLNAILIFIGASTLTDTEFSSIDPALNYAFNEETYKALLSVIDSRDLVSNDRDRLTGFFVAKGVTVTETPQGVSRIFLGATL